MLSTILLGISFVALSIIVCILNNRLDLCMERLRELSVEKASCFSLDLLKDDVNDLIAFRRDHGYVLDYYRLKCNAQQEELERMSKYCGYCSFMKDHFYPKYNPQKNKQNHGK